MKTTLLTLLLALASTAVNAGGYDYRAQIYEVNMLTCTSKAKISLGSYQMKVMGKPKYSMDDWPVTYYYVLDTYAVDYGYDKAIDEEDAYRHVFAKCWDNMDDLRASERNGLPRPNKLAY